MSDLTAAVEAAMHVMYGDHPHAENYRAHVQAAIAAAAPLIEAAARADERAKVAEDIARAIEAVKPSAARFWDTADASAAYALNHAAAIARQHAQETS